MINADDAIKAVAVIDFGTFATGYAWIPINELNRDPSQRRPIFRWQWPGQPFEYPKTRTELLCDRDGKVVAWGYAAHRMWRHQQASGTDLGLRPARWLKMNLLRRHGGGRAFSRLGAALNNGDVPERMITEYLRLVYRAALEEMAAAGYSEDEIRWCVTVPAQWSDRLKQVMRRAAAAAGLPDRDDRLILALEPEAAAHHARVSGARLVASQDGAAPDLTTPGLRFLMVDCGGGTIDLSAYRSSDDGKMEEVTPSTGDTLGSQCLTAGFIDTILIKRLGGVEEYQRLERTCPLEIDQIIDAWEREKLHVSLSMVDNMDLPLPVERRLSKAARRSLKDQQDGVGTRIIVSADEVRDIFEQVVAPILTLVDRQLGEMIDHDGLSTGLEHVLLAGGFAASPYLQQRLRDHLAGRAELLVVPDPALAVLAGAVHFAYEPHTRARRSRRTYGIGVCEPFEEGVDPEDSKDLDAFGEAVCTRRFSAFVVAGQRVRSGQVVSRDYIPLKAGQSEIDIDFMACDSTAPRYADEPGCERIGKLTIPLDEVMRFGICDRSVRVSMQFGETEIKSRVTLERGDIELRHTLEFDEE